MKLLFYFDASASSYEIKGELSMVSSWPGIKGVQLLEKVSGDAPRFCAEVDVSDDQLQPLRDRVRGLQAQYAGFVFNMKEVAYRIG